MRLAGLLWGGCTQETCGQSRVLPGSDINSFES
jgi:hypothetical protein